MTLLTTTTDVRGILPPEYGPLIWEPVAAAAVALDPAVSTVIHTASHDFHIPRVTDDAGASWLVEGAEITPDDPSMDELVVTPAKVGGLAVVSTELANDSSPAAQTIVGESIARSIAVQIDRAMFSTLPAPAPDGLEDVTGTGAVPVTDYDNLDGFAKAIATVEQAGGTVTSFVTDPATALSLATLKVETGSNAPLLGVDAANGTQRQALGVPVKVSPYVTAGTVWALDASAVFVVVREEVKLVISSDAYFSSDRVGIRATMRVGYGFPTPARIAGIKDTTP